MRYTYILPISLMGILWSIQVHTAGLDQRSVASYNTCLSNPSKFNLWENPFILYTYILPINLVHRSLYCRSGSKVRCIIIPAYQLQIHQNSTYAWENPFILCTYILPISLTRILWSIEVYTASLDHLWNHWNRMASVHIATVMSLNQHRLPRHHYTNFNLNQ